MKLTRQKVLELNHVLAHTNFEMPISARFRYTVSQNVKVTKDEIDAINEAFKMPEELNVYNSERQEIVAAAGISSDEEYFKMEEEARKELDGKIKELDEKHAEVLDKVKAINAERAEFLKDEIELPLKTIKLDDMPDISENNEFPHWQIWAVLETIVVED